MNATTVGHLQDSAVGDRDDLPLVVIERGTSSLVSHLSELWGYRELLSCLVWREVIVRYKQTVLGAAWALLQPISLMIVFTLFFRRVAGASVVGVPYSLFVLAGLLPWVFFAAR